MLVQVYGDNAMKKTAVYKWVKRFFLREVRVSLTKRDQDGQQQAELKKTLKRSSNCAWKSSADCQEHSRASEHRQRNS